MKPSSKPPVGKGKTKGRMIGYARVSTEDQEAQAQVAALRKAGVRPEHLFVEKVSSRRWDRVESQRALEGLR